MSRKVDLTDPDNPEWTVEDFKRARGPESLSALELAAFPRTRGRPRIEAPKLAVSLRLNPAVIKHFKAGGRGWQARINATLEAAISSMGIDTARAREGADH